MNGFDYKSVFKNLGFSKKMAEYLCQQSEIMEKSVLVDIICRAPVSLESKRAILQHFSYSEKLDYEVIGAASPEEIANINHNSFRQRAENINDALYELTNKNNENELLIFKRIEGRDGKEYIKESIPFSNYTDLSQYVQMYFQKSEKGKRKKNEWYLVQKYGVDEEGEYVETYSYVYINKEPVYFRNGQNKDFWGAGEVKLPVPFREGDIIIADGRPFTGKQKGLVVKTGSDGCSSNMRILTVNPEGDLSYCMIKDADCFYNTSIQLHVSPIYSLKRFHGKLKKKEKSLETAAFILNYVVKGDYQKEKSIELNQMELDNEV